MSALTPEDLDRLEGQARAAWNERQENCAKYGADLPMPKVDVAADQLCDFITAARSALPRSAEGGREDLRAAIHDLFDGGLERAVARGDSSDELERILGLIAALPRLQGDRVREAAKRVIECDDDAISARGKPNANLNGVGLVDLFDSVGHPFGTGPHKQHPYRSVNLDVALGDLRQALATPTSGDGSALPPTEALDGRVYVTVSGLTGTGKSSVLGEIEVALRALGLTVEGDARTDLRMHGDYQSGIELYEPVVVLSEVNISRQALPQPKAGVVREALEAWDKAERLDIEFREMCERADAEGWEATGESHVNEAGSRARLAMAEARSLLREALATSADGSAQAGRIPAVAWTPELEAARIDLCEYLVRIADDPHTLLVHVDLSKRLLETEQALTILGEIAISAVPQAPTLGVEWKPTHRHADGGEYRRVGDIAVKMPDDSWLPCIKYDGADGIERATTYERWADRFTEIAPPQSPASKGDT